MERPSQPYATVTEHDHTAWIYIAAILGIVYSLIFCGIRVVARRSTGRSFGTDEAALLVGTCIAVIQSITTIIAGNDGLGKSWDLVIPSLQGRIQKMYYATDLLFILSISLSKTSVTLFIRTLTPDAMQRRLHHGLVVLICIWTIAACLILGIRCGTSHPWFVITEECEDTLRQWQAVAIMDILLETMIVGLSVVLVWNLQTSFSRKATVVTAFAFRLGVIIPAVSHVRSYSSLGPTKEHAVNEALHIVWIQVEQHYALISVAIPCLRPVINRLITHYGTLGPDESTQRSFGLPKSRGTADTFELSILKLNAKHISRSLGFPKSVEPRHRIRGQSHPQNVIEHQATVHAGHMTELEHGSGLGRPSADSGDSQRMIIRKNVSWTVECGER